MTQVRQVRMRIQSVRNIEHITRAMKMVASARLHRAQAQLLAARPHAFKLAEMVRDIAGNSGEVQHPLLNGRSDAPPALFVLTSDKGLCAGFNTRTLAAAAAALQAEGPRPEVLVAGRKGITFFRRAGVPVFKEWTGFWQDLNWYHADEMGGSALTAFAAGRWSRVTLVYTRFKSSLVQEPVTEDLLPIKMTAASCGTRCEYAFEPSPAEILSVLLPRYVKNALWHALLESKAAELAARMQAMENATKSAGEMIQDLTLQMNRARQAAITREIAELVGAAEVVKG